MRLKKTLELFTIINNLQWSQNGRREFGVSSAEAEERECSSHITYCYIGKWLGCWKHLIISIYEGVRQPE